MAKRKANIEANQSLHDLAMQAYGNPEGYWQLAQDNDLDDPTQELDVGGELSFLETTSPIQEDYIRRGRRVATGHTPKPDGAFACAFAPGFNQRGCVFVQSDFNLELDGVNDWGKGNNNNSDAMKIGTDDFSVSFWAKVDDVKGRDGKGVSFVHTWDDSTSNWRTGFFVGISTDSTQNIFAVKSNDLAFSGLDYQVDDATFTPLFKQGEWQHYTVTRDSTNNWTLYLDDNQPIAMAETGSVDSNRNDFTLDNRIDLGILKGIATSNQRPIVGQMTEVILQRKLVSSQEITDRANNLGISDTQNAIAWYALDQESGGTVSDLSGNGNDINLQGYTSAELAEGGGAWVEFDPNP